MSETSGRIMNTAWEEREEDTPEDEHRLQLTTHTFLFMFLYEFLLKR